MKINSYWTQSPVFNSDTPNQYSLLSWTSSYFLKLQQTDGTAHKLKPRLFHKSAHFQVHFCRLSPLVWTAPDSIIRLPSLLSLLSSSVCKITFTLQSQKWLPLTIIPQLQLWFYHLGYPSTPFCILVTIWLICQILHKIQDKFTKEATHL